MSISTFRLGGSICLVLLAFLTVMGSAPPAKAARFAEYSFVGEFGGLPFTATMTSIDFRNITGLSDLIETTNEELSGLGLFPSPTGFEVDAHRIVRIGAPTTTLPIIYRELLRLIDPVSGDQFSSTIGIRATPMPAQFGLPLADMLFLPELWTYEELVRIRTNGVSTTVFDESFPLTLVNVRAVALNLPVPGAFAFVLFGAIALFGFRRRVNPVSD